MAKTNLKLKKRPSPSKKAAARPFKKKATKRSPTAAEALRALDEIGRSSVAKGTDKIPDEEIEAEIRAYREGK